MSININRIEITIQDNWRYGLVAFLVDREDFLKDIQKYRGQLGIDKLWSRAYLKKQHLTTKKIGRGNMYIAPPEFERLTARLQEKYQKSEGFRLVIRHALVCGEVQDADLYVPPIRIVTPTSYGRGQLALHPPEIAILLNPETDPKEILKVFKRYEVWIKNQNSPMKYLWHNYDVRFNIQRDREWYWLNKTKSYESIVRLERERKKNIHIPKATVEKAIKRYREILKLPIQEETDTYFFE